MMFTSPARSGKVVEGRTFVARDRATGHVHGTFTYSHFEGAGGEADRAAERWLRDLRTELGTLVELDMTSHPMRGAVPHDEEATPVQRPRGEVQSTTPGLQSRA